MTELDNIADEMLLLGIVLNLRQKGTVNLYTVRHISEKIADIRITRTVIINRNTGSEFAKMTLQFFQCVIFQLRLFRQFHNNAGGMFLQQFIHAFLIFFL